ncbi:MAG: hypothetical protein DRJ59_06805 [Thermoprotei archaeon]|nr:MAG: hypothetical protein DRJ59_06805 [Thermoprotei archaeon]
MPCEYRPYIFIVKFKDPLRKRELETLIKICNSFENKGHYFIFLKPQVIYSPIQLLSAFLMAKELVEEHKKIKKVSIAFLLFISGQKEIRKAMNVGLSEGDSETVLVVFSKLGKKALKFLLEEESLKDFFHSIEEAFPRTSLEKIRAFYGIKEEELKATLSETKNESILKCILMRMARVKLEFL